MSALNATVIETKVAAPFSFQTIAKAAIHVFDVTVAALVLLKTQATHNLITIPTGKVLVGCKVIVQEAFTSGGSATVQFKIGSEVLSGAIAVADLAVGKIINLNFNVWSGAGTVATSTCTLTSATPSGGTVSYAKTADLTLDMVVAAADLTAGKFILIPEYIDVAAILTRG